MIWAAETSRPRLVRQRAGSLVAGVAWALALLLYGQQAKPAAAQAPGNTNAIPAGASPSALLPDPASVWNAVVLANDYFQSHDTLLTNGWARGTYYTADMRAYQVLGAQRYYLSALAWATSNQWQAGIKGATNADGQVCGQTYIDLYRINPEPFRIAAVKAGVDARVAAPDAVQDWWWIDAFYMAGPVFARFGNLYATNTYFDKLWLMYDDMKTRRALFDPAFGLWYRDAPAQTATTRNGKKQFWSRGNGWVMAGLARVLEEMAPGQDHRDDFVAMLQNMAAALKPLQGADGMWRSSLLDAAEYPNPETSGTALFTYAMAWGIRHGYLDPAVYQDVVARAWNGMVTNALHPDGLVGYVQAQGRLPDATTYDTTFDFGVGVFVLAGSEMALLGGGAPTAPVLVTQPSDRGLPPGTNLTLSATVVGLPPLAYQWFKDGSPLPGATNATLARVNIQANDSGRYSLVTTNLYGAVSTVPAMLTVLTLPVALNTPNWVWTTGGSALWTGEGSLSGDGVGAVQSGRIIDNQTTWLETTLTGPASLFFSWKVSSQTNSDLLRFYVNGAEQMRLSGEVDWQSRTFNLAAGSQTLRWAYSKNGNSSRGQDRAWVDQVGIVCGYTLSPPASTHGFGAEAGSINLITSNSLCPWTVSNSNTWIVVAAGGAGSTAIGYEVAANPTAIPRLGVVMIADRPFAVSQEGAPCTFALTPAAASHGFGVETGLVSVTTLLGCDWLATTTNDWITLTYATNGSDSASIAYSVAANPTAIPRSGAMAVADQVATINQAGAPCVYSLVAAEQNHGYGTETGLVMLSTLVGCDWAATTTEDWIVLTSSTNGTGSGNIGYLVMPNPTGIPRSGTMLVADQAFAVHQTAAPCLFSLLPTSGLHGASVETGSVSVATLLGCDWTAATTNDWISILPPIQGTNTGTVSYLVATNPNPVIRVGTIAVADQIFTVTNLGSLSLTCVAERTVECGAVWDFDEPAFANGCTDTNVALRLAGTTTNGIGACGRTFTATRTWTATDSCGNQATCSQTVSLVDTIPPTMTCLGDKTVEAGGTWDFDPPAASDICSGTDVTITSPDTKTNTSGFCGSTFQATRTWQAVDACGNRAACSQTVTVLDTTPPTLACAADKAVICNSGWSFDPPSGLDAADGTNLTILALETVTNGDCGQIFSARRTWAVMDQCGNTATCAQTVTNIQVVICGTLFQPTNYPAGGPSQKRLASVPMDLTGDATQTIPTSADGTYRFWASAGGTFTIRPADAEFGDAADGISTVDISLIRRHILNTSRFDSPYKLLAADVNDSQSVTTLDISWIRKLILGVTNRFPAGRWRFVPADYAFPDPSNPWDAPTGRTYTNLLESVGSQDFVALKLGDVNNSWSPAAGLANPALKRIKAAAAAAPAATGPEVDFRLGRYTNAPGELAVAELRVSGFRQVTSAQFTLIWDPGVLRFEGTGDYALGGLGAGDFGALRTNQGQLSFSWDDPQAAGVTVGDGTSIFTVRFRVIGPPGAMSPLALADTATQREVGVNFALGTLVSADGEVIVSGSPLKTARMTQVALSQKGFSFAVSTVSGQLYIPEYSDRLPGTNWTALPAVPGDGTVKVLTAPVDGARQQFYRLRIE